MVLTGLSPPHITGHELGVNMDPLSQLLSFAFIVFSLLVGGIIFIFRIIVEFIWKNAPNNKVWEDLILPVLPAPVGTCLAYFAAAYPYGTGFTTTSGRLAFGFVAGLLSSMLYRVVKATLKQKLATLDPSLQTTTPTTVSTTTSTTTSTTSASNSIPTMSADLHNPQ
jgi:hypothetical protein